MIIIFWIVFGIMTILSILYFVVSIGLFAYISSEYTIYPYSKIVTMLYLLLATGILCTIFMASVGFFTIKTMITQFG